MTLELETLSHGKIESGFLSAFTRMIRLGEYSFFTENFCNLAKQIAEEKTRMKGRILSYDLKYFDSKMGEEMNSLLRMHSMYSEDYLKNISPIDTSTIEEKIDLQGDGKYLPVKIYEDYSKIKIGKYEISSAEFAIMAKYVSQGGFCGWMNHKFPKYAKASLESITHSENPLFKEIRERKHETKRNYRKAKRRR